MRAQRHAPAALYPRERPGTHCTCGWVGPRAGLDRCGKSRLPPGFDPRTVHPVASRYTDYAPRPMICTTYQILFRGWYQEKWDQWRCGTCGREERDVQGFGGETWRKDFKLFVPLRSRAQHTEHANRAAQILNQWLCEQLYELSWRWACGPETCRDPAIYE